MSTDELTRVIPVIFCGWWNVAPSFVGLAGTVMLGILLILRLGPYLDLVRDRAA